MFLNQYIHDLFDLLFVFCDSTQSLLLKFLLDSGNLDPLISLFQT